MQNNVWEGWVRKKTEKHPNARPIDELAADVRALLVAKLPKADYFALQLDESTDVSNDAQLLAFLWFVDQNEMQEEFLFCKQLPGGKKKFRDFQSDRQFFPWTWYTLAKMCRDVHRRCKSHVWRTACFIGRMSLPKTWMMNSQTSDLSLGMRYFIHT